jgi:hypothetical protein
LKTQESVHKDTIFTCVFSVNLLQIQPAVRNGSIGGCCRSVSVGNA